ncbi:MAG: hypothetical protein ACJ75B_01915 [Flavisolibacter sp.]
MDRFKEYLEEQMDYKRTCTISFRFVEGGVSTIKARIIKIDEVSGRNMIETDAGLVIGLDQIIQVNERKPDNYC